MRTLRALSNLSPLFCGERSKFGLANFGWGARHSACHKLSILKRIEPVTPPLSPQERGEGAPRSGGHAGLPEIPLPFEIVGARYDSGDGLDRPLQPAPDIKPIAQIVRPSVHHAIVDSLVVVVDPGMGRRADAAQPLRQPQA